MSSRKITYTAAAAATLLASAYIYRQCSCTKSSTKAPLAEKNQLGATVSNSKAFVPDSSWVALPLTDIKTLSPDTKRFTFQLPQEDQVSGLTVASALLTKFITPKGSNVIRPYTPVTDLNKKGSFDLVIKVYPEGKMTNHIFNLKLNETLLFKGPLLKFDYPKNTFNEITLLGAGTGITPLYQILTSILSDPDQQPNTKINLLYGNKTPQDILLKPELDELQKKFSDTFKVTYFVDQLNNDLEYNGELGYISKDYLKKSMLEPKSTKNQKIFICGPPPFMNCYSGPKASPKEQGELSGILKDLGYTSEQVFKF
ncbi:hypothetical protein TBLA_0A10090 [Henningerozyma blattae CBS 6284]|uniref:NADH-cytochrome b5 reductase n=1 Tax=Henningerozyma blattae (strain ATCC 34711 / CBS 6284 / DSM 70876 / NBRC 10599 / NRRL Y-10934 / UCD 77-7) TaxID=1071380 RepID=I2GXD7_HENB6|nr:hypothetical protein TBLA_0A10090 [Tetrapisispora blattae CBS 6284]CCH58789.1 hypothetical protein TBLA_0A10090 [Tetrapisispora blattae CBS 6284]